jgi:hypothetical protein
MPTVNSQGDLTADGTEQTLWDVTTNKWFSGWIDLENMASGDTTVIKTYVKVRSTGVATLSLWSVDTYVDAQTNKPIVFVAPMPSDIEFKVTLTQSAGTNRVYPWKVYES